MAADMLCSLPTGVAVVRTIQNGAIEGAIVRVPYRECESISDAQYAADHRLIMSRSDGIPMEAAVRTIRERERVIIERARANSLPPSEPSEAKDFRVAARNRKRRTDDRGE
jgi:hypothetical protein